MTGEKRKQVAFAEVEQRDMAEELAGDAEEEDDDLQEGAMKFTIWKEIVIWASVFFYIADLGLDYWVMACYFRAEKPRIGWFIFFCFLTPNLYAGYKSLQWYLRAHAHDPVRLPAVWLIRLLFFPISPLLRYWDTWQYGRKSRRAYRRGDVHAARENFENYLVESAEVSMLRLFIIFLEDAPIAVVNLEGLISIPADQWEMSLKIKPDAESMKLGVVVAKLFCTMTLGVVHCMSSNKMAWHMAHSGQCFVKDITTSERRALHEWRQKGFLTCPAEFTAYTWQLLSIASRLVAYSLFGVVQFGYLWLLILLRWVLHSVWIFCDVPEMSFVNAIAFGGVYLFSFISTSPGKQILRIALYYVITLAEDVIIAILWVSQAPDDVYRHFGPGYVAVMFGGLAGGVFFMCLYYNLFHPEREQTWLRECLRSRRSRL